jgi:5-methylthioribose kinase
MNTQSILTYIHHTPHLLEQFKETSLYVNEIGDGNLNYIFRISDAANHSFILKYAPPYLRLLGEDFKLPQNRICVEMHTMCYFESIAPSFVPHILHCDEKAFCFAMEDLNTYRLLQRARLEGEISLEIYTKLGLFLALLYTHKPPIHEEGFYENATLKSISEDYIFRFPHIINHKALIVPPFFTPTPKSDLFHKNMHALTSLFLHVKECLVHGDLHTGSILIHDEDVKIIDAEFSLYAPLGFDMGVLFAHILFGELYACILGKAVQIEASLLRLWESFILHVKHPPAHILSHSVGFCGAELFRRLVVPSKAKPLDTLPLELQPKAYEKVEKLSITLVENYLHVSSIHDMLRFLKEDGWF